MKNADQPARPTPIAGAIDGLVYHTMDIDHQLAGLTKREQLAGMAMQGLLSANATDYHGNTDAPVPSYVAHDAVCMADALLTELENTKK